MHDSERDSRREVRPVMGSGAFVAKITQDLRASYWFIPFLLVLFAFVFAQFTLWIDRLPGDTLVPLPSSMTDTQTDGARSTLAVIAQSVIGVTGVMFSMTIVAVSFAAGNFGPRLIGNFMRDRGNQVSLGILIATFVYAVVVLRSVQSEVSQGADLFVPHLSVLVAIGLAFICVFTMIYFVHHVPETINVSRITAALGRRLCADIAALIDRRSAAEETGINWPERPCDLQLELRSAGYVQALNFGRLRELAEEKGWLVHVEAPPGVFVTPGSPALSIWSEDEPGDEDLADLRNCFALGASRTEHQNVEFIAEQLAEMIARALSPGVNDPFTALNCLNWLNAGLVTAIEYEGGLQPSQTGRVRTDDVTVGGLLDASIGVCRQYLVADDLAREHAIGILEKRAVRAEGSAKESLAAARQLLLQGRERGS